MSKDIRKSLSRLSDIVDELKKSDGNGAGSHATVENVKKFTKPIGAAKPPEMPIAKSNVPKLGKGLPKPTHGVPAAKTTQPVKHLKANPTKEKAYMKVQKSIVLISKELDPSSFRPISDDTIRKSFGSIPEIMKDISNRPHDAWWERGMQRASNFEDQPANYLGKIWYGDISKDTPWAEEEYHTAGEMNKPNPTQEVEGPATVDEDDESIKKWLSGALEGGGYKAMRGHPKAGPVISKCAINVGKSILGKSSGIMKSGVGEIDPEALGNVIIEAIDEIVNGLGDEKVQKAWAGTLGGMMIKSKAEELMADTSNVQKNFVQKRVAEPIGSKYSPQQRKSKLGEEYDGESAVSGDGTKLNVHAPGGLLDKNETISDM